jgi:hypothetical protein
MTRKEFLRLGLTTAAVAACGGSSAGNSTGSGGTPMQQGASGNCLMNGTAATISGNHGHVLVVSKEDVAAGAQKTYDIRGAADHSHQVTLTSADMAALGENMQAHEASTVALSHSHAITVSCA